MSSASPLVRVFPLKIPPHYPNIHCLLPTLEHLVMERPRIRKQPKTWHPRTRPFYLSQVELISPDRRQMLFLTSVGSGTCGEKWHFEYAI